VLGVQFLLERRLAEVFLNLAFALIDVMPVGEACVRD
jgi:hypothetical protein